MGPHVVGAGDDVDETSPPAGPLKPPRGRGAIGGRVLESARTIHGDHVVRRGNGRKPSSITVISECPVPSDRVQRREQVGDELPNHRV